MRQVSARAALLCSCVLVLCTTAVAQGGDACDTPTAIAGVGSFAFDSSLATTGTQGQAETLCYAFGSSTVDNDVWFAWTSDYDGTAVVKTCGTTAVDTKISAYPGSGCPTTGTSLACNDDACGLQSVISFPAVNGTSYML